MHSVDQAQSLFHTAFLDQPLYHVGDVHEAPAVRHFKPKMLGKRFHVLKGEKRLRKLKEKTAIS